ncbi:MAG: hypothetical protein ACOY3Z_02390 [Thermodesulfobacteriota bacterium]
MIWPFGKKRYLALTGDNRSAMLTEIQRGPVGEALPRLLASTDDPLTSDVALPRLLAAAGNIPGLVALSLPLSFFETVSVSLPLMPDAAVAKALPYHLAKAVNAPLESFVYDWQINGRQKDRLQIVVYLFPSAIFQRLRREFLRKEAQLAFFEPDVFSVFAFLAQTKRLVVEEATLCALLWQDSVSLAVHEKNRLPLARVVREQQPLTPFQLPIEDTISPAADAIPEEELLILEEEPAAPVEPVHDTDALLADFAILSANASLESVPASQAAPTPQTPSSWTDYLHQVILEIMRTRDYYASVQKGAAIRHIVVGGADPFWNQLAVQGKDLLATDFIPLQAPSGAATRQPLLDVLAIGAGARW